MRRSWGLVGALTTVALISTACMGSSSSTTAKVNTTPGATHTPVTITFWDNYTAPHELSTFNASFAAFHKAYPWITVAPRGGVDDTKILAAITSGTPPDALLSFLPDNVGKFCSTGAWTSLDPYITQDHLDLNQFPRAALTYSSFRGEHCSLPALADSYGLYSNTGMLAAHGITQPPHTLTELAADAKKLTVFNPDGSIKTAGFIPFGTFYEDSVTGGLVQATGARWFDANGKANLANDPRWAQLLTWQKQLIDWYGYAKLQRYVAGKGDEFSTSNNFETGKLAMVYDGEWRTTFIRDDKAHINYATAPFPAADTQPQQYGSGFISGNLVAIPKGSKHPGEAWLLIKFLATDTHNLARLSNGLGNIPTTTASVNSPDVTPNPKFATFLRVFTNPLSSFSPVTPIGQAYQDLFAAFLSKWEAGSITDLHQALVTLDRQIDDQLAQQSVP